MLYYAVVSIIFYCHPYLGKISNLTNILQVGWNHVETTNKLYDDTCQDMSMPQPTHPTFQEFGN